MSERYSITNKWRLEGPGISMPAKPSDTYTPNQAMVMVNAAFAAGAASTPRPAGEAKTVNPRCSRCGSADTEPTNHAAAPPDCPWFCNDCSEWFKAAALQPPSGTGGQAGDFGEPWHAVPVTLGNGGQRIGIYFGEPDDTHDPACYVYDLGPHCHARAARIVACVNALAGMNPAAVQVVIDAAKALSGEYHDDGLIQHGAVVDLRAALASLSTGDAEGGKP